MFWWDSEGSYKIVERKTKNALVRRECHLERVGHSSGSALTPTLSQRKRGGAQGGVRARSLQFCYSRMRQRHDFVQAPGMVGLSHLRVGQVGKRHTCLGVSPGV